MKMKFSIKVIFHATKHNAVVNFEVEAVNGAGLTVNESVQNSNETTRVVPTWDYGLHW